MNIKQFFIEHDDEFLQFDRVENKLSNRRDLCAFILLGNLIPSEMNIISASDYDKIFLDTDLVDALESTASEYDLLTLIRCGVMYNKYNCLEMFV